MENKGIAARSSEEVASLLGLALARMTKWKLAKTLGVSWHTVHMWHKGVFKPCEENMARLRQLNELA